MTALAIAGPVAGQTDGATHAKIRDGRPADMLEALRHGNAEFVRGGAARTREPFDEGVRRGLEHGVRPRAIVLTGADSRLVPETIFQTDVGELYVVRVAAGACDDATLASLEFAASRYGIELCIVLGHDRSDLLRRGGQSLRATAAGQRLFERFTPALRLAHRDTRGQKKSAQDRMEIAVTESVHETIAEALRRSPLIRDLLQQDAFRFAPAVYQSKSGNVRWLRPRPYDLGALKIDDAAESAGRVQRVRGLPPHVVARMLHAGHLRFLSRGIASGDISAKRRAALAEGQRPIAVVVADADPRVAPERIFDVGLGDLFVVRVAGHQMSVEVVAAIEHAVDQTGASMVVVLAQDRSDAVQFAIDQAGSPRSAGVGAMLDWLRPGVSAVAAQGIEGDALVRGVAEYTARRFVRELRGRSEVLRGIEREGYVALLPALYEVGSGDLVWIGGAGVDAGHGHGDHAVAQVGDDGPPEHAGHWSGGSGGENAEDESALSVRGQGNGSGHGHGHENEHGHGGGHEHEHEHGAATGELQHVDAAHDEDAGYASSAEPLRRLGAESHNFSGSDHGMAPILLAAICAAIGGIAIFVLARRKSRATLIRT